jgi:hypothetical protein
VELESTQWSSRTIPQGTENPIDIATLTFALPIWISSPAKVKKLGVVERIIAQVFDAQGDASNAVLDNDLLLGTRQVITPYSYQTLLLGNRLQALRQPQVVQPNNASLDPPESPGGDLMWPAIVELYGTLRPGISYVRLEQEDGSEVVGTVSYDPTDNRFLLIDIDEDTVPANTLDPVNAVVNPLLSGPNNGLPAPVLNQRYLLTDDVGSYESPTAPVAWQGASGIPLVAKANDIIVYDGVVWRIYFNHVSSPDNIQYVTNITTGIQYKWINNVWVKSYQGLYPGGQWSLVL